MVETILAIIVAVLGIMNLLLGRKNKQAQGKIRDLEQEKHNERYETIRKERERADKRLRDMLDNYRGPGGKA